jgi:mRNA interferase MazF
VNRGEIWWVETPGSARRPHLILSRQSAIPLLTTVLAVPATRTVRGIPTEVFVDEGDGMPGPSALSFDNLLTIRKGYFVDRITRLGADRMAEVCRALNVATGCG